MIWKKGIEVLPTPSAYSADIEDTDKDSYSSAIDGSLIDNPIAIGLLNLSMSWDLNSEEEAEQLMRLTYENPLILTVKVPVVKGGILQNAKFRVSKRKIDMIDTEKRRRNDQNKMEMFFQLNAKRINRSTEERSRGGK